MMKHLRSLLLIAALALSVAVPGYAQTALDTTTITEAMTATADTAVVASATNIEAGDLIVIDREALRVRSISGSNVRVSRGVSGTPAQAHVDNAFVYIGAGGDGDEQRFYASVPRGGCTRANESYLPRVVLPSGDVWDCPVGTAPVWTLLNSSATHTSRSVWFNLDNGSGTTIDDVVLRPARPIRITAARIVYVDATTGTVAAGTASVGTTVGGVDIVAATAYENSKAVGTSTAMVIATGEVAANTMVVVRHTGVAVTQAGQSVIEIDWHYR